MKISIVIPVYNEEDTLRACLEAIANQDLKADEVIVVDNNSTDKTVEIAKSFKFVKVIVEKRQGRAYARSTGFNVATGEILGRIDSDTIIAKNWTKQLIKIFSNKDVAAVSGRHGYYDGLWPEFNGEVDYIFRLILSKQMLGNLFLNGGNMAILSSAWQDIKNDVCFDDEIHEDLDLSIHLNDAGHLVIFSKDLYAKISLRRFTTGFSALSIYIGMIFKTYKFHHKKINFYFYILLVALVVFYWYIKINAIYFNHHKKKLN